MFENRSNEFVTLQPKELCNLNKNLDLDFSYSF